MLVKDRNAPCMDLARRCISDGYVCAILQPWSLQACAASWQTKPMPSTTQAWAGWQIPECCYRRGWHSRSEHDAQTHDGVRGRCARQRHAHVLINGMTRGMPPVQHLLTARVLNGSSNSYVSIVWRHKLHKSRWPVTLTLMCWPGMETGTAGIVINKSQHVPGWFVAVDVARNPCHLPAIASSSIDDERFHWACSSV